MNSRIENEKLVIELNGRIDTSNASQVESEIESIISANKGLTPAFDAEKLEYISSIGLRILLKVAKTYSQKLQLLNASKDVYDIFETTGFINILEVQKALRQISVEGCELLGKGGNGSVYRLDDDKIVKVYKPWMKRETIDQERAFARNAFMNGVPSVIAYDLVRCGDCYGVVFELIKSKTLGQTIKENPDKLEEYVDKYVALAKHLHSIHVEPGTFTDLKKVLHQRVPKIAQWTSQEERDLLESLIDCIPDTDTLIHNDLHPGNIMIQDGELLLIDMPEMCNGPTAYDLVGIYRDMIVAPSGNSANHIEASVGLPADKVMQVGNMFFAKYTGISNPEEMEAYYKKLGLLFAFNVSLVVGTESENAMKLAPMLMDKLLRGVVIPNEQTLRYLLSNLNSF